MAYSLIFTIYSLIFSVLLLITIFFKKKIDSSKSKIYLLLIFSAMLFGILEIVSVLYYKITNDFDIYAILWKIRNVVVISYAYFYFAYYILIFSKNKNDNSLVKTIIKNPLLLIVFIILTVVVICYLLFVKVQPMDSNNIHFVRGIAGVILVGTCTLVAIISMVIAIIFRKKYKKIYSCFILVSILFFTVIPIQLKFQHVSLMPFI